MHVTYVWIPSGWLYFHKLLFEQFSTSPNNFRYQIERLHLKRQFILQISQRIVFKKTIKYYENIIRSRAFFRQIDCYIDYFFLQNDFC